MDAPRETVWDVLVDPDVYEAVAPNLSVVEIVSGDGAGMVRRCVDTNGNAWTETVDHWDDGHQFGVTVDVADSEFHRRLFDRFDGRWAVEERADDVLVTVEFEYETKYGPLGWPISKFFQYKAPGLVAEIFDGWEAEIAERLGNQVAGHTDEATASH